MFRTGLYVAVAVVAMFIAMLTGPDKVTTDLFADKGKDFFPEFTSAEGVGALQVSVFSPRLGTMYRFRVQKEMGTATEEVEGEPRTVQKMRWTIPSHHSYPADGTENSGSKQVNRVALEAGAFVGLRKKDVVSDDPDAHSDYQVLDPEQPGLEEDGYGRRVTFEDRDGNALASLIIGKLVPGENNQYYVRVPEKPRTYIAELDRSISTRFEDWIEDDLLKVDSWNVTQLRSDAYSVDEQTGTRVPGEVITASKVDNQWVVSDLPGALETDTSKVSAIASALDSLKIVGVRPKPDDLAELLAGKTDRVSQGSLASLQQQGFYPTQGGLVANEGEITARTKAGVVYILMFGEVLYGEGDAVTAGSNQEQEATSSEEQAANRYLMILASFDDSLLEKPTEEPLEEEELTKRASARREIERLIGAVNSFRESHNDELPKDFALLLEEEDAAGEKCLDEIKKDPWGADYQLRPTDDTDFVIFSYAANGEEGGLGPNVDVASDNFKNEDDLKEVRSSWDEFQEKVEEGQKEAQELAERFAPWYYVISNESFEKLRVPLSDLTKEVEASEEDASSDPAPFELPNLNDDNPFDDPGAFEGTEGSEGTGDSTGGGDASTGDAESTEEAGSGDEKAGDEKAGDEKAGDEKAGDEGSGEGGDGSDGSSEESAESEEQGGGEEKTENSGESGSEESTGGGDSSGGGTTGGDGGDGGV